MSFVSGWLFHCRNIAEPPRWTRKTLPFLRNVSSHFLLTRRCFHSYWYFIVPLRDTWINNTHDSLTFTIFIIQSQIGALPVFSRLLWTEVPFWTQSCLAWRNLELRDQHAWPCAVSRSQKSTLAWYRTNFKMADAYEGVSRGTLKLKGVTDGGVKK